MVFFKSHFKVNEGHLENEIATKLNRRQSRIAKVVRKITFNSFKLV